MDTKEQEKKQLLKEIDSIPGLFRDDDDHDEKATYSSVDIMGLGIDIQINKNVMDIYLSFGYTDISSEHIKGQSIYDMEDLENNEHEYWTEKYFIIFLKANADHSVAEWDDGAYMCPGYVARIGYQKILCKTETIKNFISLCEKFYRTIRRWKSSTLLSKITDDFIKRLGYSNTYPCSGKLKL
jgi:hypothetical protein